MKKDYKCTQNSKVVVEVEYFINDGEFKDAINEAYKEGSKKITIPGFRKGNVPFNVFVKKYGKERLYIDAIEELYNKKYSIMIKDEEFNYKLIGGLRPKYELIKFDELNDDSTFSLFAEFDVYPELDDIEYKGLELKKPDFTITDIEINDRLSNYIQKDIKYEEVKDGTVEYGDICEFDFKGSVNGEYFPGGTAQNYSLKIGSGQFIKGFEEQMVGMKKGEEKDILVTFPENYPGNQDLASKEAKFEIKINKIKKEIKPELTDEYIKELKIENINTLEELKNKIKDDLKQEKEAFELNNSMEIILNKLVENNKFELPSTILNHYLISSINYYKNEAKKYNISYEMYLQLLGSNKETFEKQMEESSKQKAFKDMIVEKLMSQLDIKVLDEDYKTLEHEMQIVYRTKDLNEIIKNNKESFENNLKYIKLFDVIKKAAKFS